MQPAKPVTFRIQTGKRGKARALEICCGHAGLTATLVKHGFEATGVDWHKNQHETVVPILKADLTTPEGQALVWDLVRHPATKYVHLGPPCGTFSRARAIPVPKKARKHFRGPPPRPLRSDEHPEGLSHYADGTPLSQKDKDRVESGNTIARFCAEVAKFCAGKKKFFTVENPTGSILWLLPEFAALRASEGVFEVQLHACMFGSGRDKRTSLLTNMQSMEALRKQCNHKPGEHLPWGISRSGSNTCWATQEECEYPPEFCEAIAAAAAAQAEVVPEREPQKLKPKTKPSSKRLLLRAAVGRQAKNAVRSTAVPERKPAQWFQVPATEWLDSCTEHLFGAVKEDMRLGNHAFPKGSRILQAARQQTVGEGGPSQNPEKEAVVRILAELPWSDLEFFDLARESKHPLNGKPIVPDDTLRAIVGILKFGRDTWKAKAKQRVQQLQKRKEQLSARETELKRQLPESTRKVNDGKPILLFKECLESLGHPDVSVALDCLTGFPIVGEIPHCGIFEEKPEHERR